MNDIEHAPDQDETPECFVDGDEVIVQVSCACGGQDHFYGAVVQLEQYDSEP